MSTPPGPPNDPNDPRQGQGPAQPHWQPPNQPYGSPPNPQPPGQPGPGFEGFGSPQQPRYADYYRPMPGQFNRPSNASTILILGILGLVICAPCGIAAWIMGKQTLKEMDRGLMDPRDRGMANAGMICGIIASVLMILGICFWTAAIGFAFVAR